MTVKELLEKAVVHKAFLATTDNDTRNRALLAMAEALRANTDQILAANDIDLANADGKISEVMKDRLRLTKERIGAMADAVVEVTRLPDPLGRKLDFVTRENGIEINKISVPLGVLAMIYESRPNVTSDAAALSIKSGNVCVLRGGKEAINSNKAIATALREGVSAAGMPEDVINLVEDTSRDSATALMTARGLVDMLIPRGGAGLIRSCVENAKVPCIETGTGICHVYIDEFADKEKAVNIINNAKTSRPSVCNAAEVMLIHKAVADGVLPEVKRVLVDDRKKAGLTPVELRLDTRAAAIIDGTAASDSDFDTEFLDYILAVRVVDSVDEAIAHIAAHSTGHSECIVTENKENAERFTSRVDSAAVYVNASTRFTDGGEFGLGCEMGISTQKLHARGPMGLCELTSYKYVINGNGQIR
ncbi:MAG: glutamate-5-semialdehyde dehydrogenase [Clostridia bacterium]|nr:glutamate-5-semialdehyde dehydrogenase [Clostridia bacterium]